MARRFMMKHLTEVACIHTLSTHAAPVRQFALMRERRVELLGDPSGERIVELERVEVGFASYHTGSTQQREFGSRGNLGNFGAGGAAQSNFRGALAFKLQWRSAPYDGQCYVRTFSRTAGRSSGVVLRRAR